MYRGNTYDFGGYKGDKCLIYEEGDRDMQSASIVATIDVSHKIAEDDTEGEKARRLHDVLHIIDRLYQHQWFIALPLEERLKKTKAVLDGAMTINSMIDYIQELREKSV